MLYVANIDDLAAPDVQALVAEHLAGMASASPPGHVFAHAIERLRRPDVTFWTVWSGDDLCGCVALQTLNAEAAELKSMRTRAAWQRRGVAQFALTTALDAARARGHRRVYLETGTAPAFDAALRLYARNGFGPTGPFGSYHASSFNTFRVLNLV